MISVRSQAAGRRRRLGVETRCSTTPDCLPLHLPPAQPHYVVQHPASRESFNALSGLHPVTIQAALQSPGPRNVLESPTVGSTQHNGEATSHGPHGFESSLSLRGLGLPEVSTTPTSLNRRDATGSSRLSHGAALLRATWWLSARKDDYDYVCDRGLRHYTDRVLRTRELRGREYKMADITTRMTCDGHQSSPARSSRIKTLFDEYQQQSRLPSVSSTTFASIRTPLLYFPSGKSSQDIQSRVMSVPTQMRPCHHWRPLTTSHQGGLPGVLQWKLVLLRV